MTVPGTPPGTPEWIGREVCPDHGLAASEPLGCGCDARWLDSEAECICDDVNKTFCTECKAIVEHPVILTYRLFGVCADATHFETFGSQREAK